MSVPSERLPVTAVPLRHHIGLSVEQLAALQRHHQRILQRCGLIAALLEHHGRAGVLETIAALLSDVTEAARDCGTVVLGKGA